LPRELVKRPKRGLPETLVGWFAWCNVRPTHLLTCVSVRDGWCNARTVALTRSGLRVGPASGVSAGRIEFFREPLSAVQESR
jgi:hypothetical protein